MKNKPFFKLFTLFFALVVLIIPAWSKQIDSNNVLFEIQIESSDNNSYNLNLFFKEKYTGNALMQKNKNNSYYLYIPDTKINNKKTKITYKNKYDKSSIIVIPEEINYERNGIESNYVKISVNMAENYPLKLITKSLKDKKSMFSKSLNLFSFTILFAILLLVFLIFQIIKSARKNNYSTSYVYAPLEKETDFETGGTLNNNKTTIPNIKEISKSKEDNFFSCFDIPLEKESASNSKNYKSPLKETSVILKNKNSNLKQTNPINDSYINEFHELELPLAEDILRPVTEEKIIKKEPDLISKLEITPTKGFYLTFFDNNFVLCGYTGKNVYLLQKFNDLSQINLHARYYDSRKNCDLYILKLDSYRAIIEISDTGMKELAVL